jgi:murein DD-endopeptidase MepM/ murein hydrolase activator NlpD
MILNPFTESNLENLQNDIIKLSADILNPISRLIKSKWEILAKNAKEHITIIIVPHNEKKILNLNFHIYSILILVTVLVLGLAFTSVAIINYTYTSKNVLNLTQYDLTSKVQIRKYKEEINILYNKFQELKSGLSLLYITISDDNSNSLWAKGGETISNNSEPHNLSPSIEELNMKEMDQELKVTCEVLEEIKNYLKNKKIIENTPSIRPVRGYILSQTTGETYSGFYGQENMKGITIAAFPGSKIRATAPGKVEAVAWDKSLGLKITIRHKYGFSSVFSYCQNAIVKASQNVSRGETIAYAGRTGTAVRSVCFYQIKIGNEFVNPLPYIK